MEEYIKMEMLIPGIIGFVIGLLLGGVVGIVVTFAFLYKWSQKLEKLGS